MTSCRLVSCLLLAVLLCLAFARPAAAQETPTPTVVVVFPTATPTAEPSAAPAATLDEVVTMQRNTFVWLVFIGVLSVGVLILSFLRVRT